MRAALFLGFGLTFGIWLFAGYFFLNRVNEIETQTATVDARYMQSQDRLSTVRAQILLGSVYVRDALLDPASAAEHRAKIEEFHAIAVDALGGYEPVLDSGAERDRVQRLEREIETFHLTMLEVLSGDSSQWPATANQLLRTKVVPRREAVIAMSEEIQALNRGAFIQQQRAVADIYANNQRALWISLGLAVAASLAVGLLVARYAGRLESSLEAQHARAAADAQELQRLSAKLITAQEEERRAIARELHDEVGQVLMAIRVELAVAQRSVETAGGNPRLLDDMRTITEGALTTVRDLSHLLHPALLDDLGLNDAIEWYLRGFSRRYDIRAELVPRNMSERLAPELEASAYRIVQEALTNIAKHARATECRVLLERTSGILRVSVEDDGVGFDPAGVKRDGPQGLGLVSIRERAIQLQGQVTLTSMPGQGTRLVVELPVRLRQAVTDG